MKNIVVILCPALLLAACGDKNEPVSLKDRGEVQEQTPAADFPRAHPPAVENLTLNGIAAVWSFNPDAFAAQQSAHGIAAGPRAADTPGESLAANQTSQERMAARLKRLRPIRRNAVDSQPGAVIARAGLIEAPVIGAVPRPGDKVGPRAGDNVEPHPPHPHSGSR